MVEGAERSPAGRLSLEATAGLGATALLGFGAVLWVALGHDTNLGSWRWLLALTLAFAATESLPIQIEVRRDTHGVHFSDMPVALGLFLLNPLGLALARSVGVLVGSLFTPVPLIKRLFNVALYVSTTLIAYSVQQLCSPHGHLGLAAGAGALLGVLLASAFEFAAVQGAIYLNEGTAPTAETGWTLWIALLAALFSGTVGVITYVLVEAGSWQPMLLVPLGLSFYVGYRVYGALLRRHVALGRLYETSRTVRPGQDLTGLERNLLQRAVELLNARSATLELTALADGTGPRRTTLGPSGVEVVDTLDDSVHAEVRRRQQPVLVTRSTADVELKAWLAGRDARDAVVVPLPSESGVIGTLEVTGHLAESRSFREEDLHLLETLATQAGFALENSSLLERLRLEATHDDLTGLVNRSQFMTEVAAEVRDDVPVAVCILDLDEFKDINDALGHTSGDQLLCAVAQRLLAAAPPQSTVARLGGDEFAVLLRRPGGEGEAERTARSLVDSLLQSVTLEGSVMDIEGSIGVALHPEHGRDATSLLQHADIAMYHAKDRRLGVRVFDDSLDDGTARRLALVAQLRQALRSRELVVYYQPKVQLSDDVLAGVEALVRWNHPTRGLVLPDEFIGAAEHTGLIAPLTTLVLDEAVAQCRAWLDEGKRIPVAVNVSVRALLDSAFVDEVAGVVRHHGVPGHLLTLELTETSIMDDRASAGEALTRIAELGVHISVDDFGTGYSSLAQLSRLPVHEVKIDKSFVFGMGTEANDEAVVNAVVQLAHHMGKVVVAEGVEDRLSLRKLEEMGCDIAQGYLFSRPLPPEKLATWIRDNLLYAPDAELRPAAKARPLRLVSRG
ncbi:diguanylate cyclase (GGDEF)-like protein [Motilibacter peucedani]|uniref:Diguanylate cyclase (GGDEF)-like protein n=1 Tax=Motilibacter peucedani TaxID=598650 RepID=A0A420XTQ9_9ACTN|nr:EAL domain-containing protein [Motilibacter peucedani]RKS80204.1 diguanylate cyclase (GGDEF)-like protein [Motilibacter peucedani]